jgi:hypothetical protein
VELLEDDAVEALEVAGAAALLAGLLACAAGLAAGFGTARSAGTAAAGFRPVTDAEALACETAGANAPVGSVGVVLDFVAMPRASAIPNGISAARATIHHRLPVSAPAATVPNSVCAAALLSISPPKNSFASS